MYLGERQVFDFSSVIRDGNPLAMHLDHVYSYDARNWLAALFTAGEQPRVLVRMDYILALKDLHYTYCTAPEEGAHGALRLDNLFLLPFYQDLVAHKKATFTVCSDSGTGVHWFSFSVCHDILIIFSGSSTFLGTLFKMLVHAGLPTVYISRPRRFYVSSDGTAFSIDSRQEISEWESHLLPSKTWFLVDMEEIPDYLTHFDGFLIHACTTHAATGWALSPHRHTSHFFLGPWTLQELISAFVLLSVLQSFCSYANVDILRRSFQPNFMTEVALKAFCEKYGSTPAIAYKYAMSKDDAVERNIRHEVERVFASERSFLMASARETHGYQSPYLVHTLPICDNHDFEFSVSGSYTLGRLTKADDKKRAEEINHLYQLFQHHSRTRALAGEFLDVLFVDLFAMGGEWSIGPMMRGNSGPKNDHFIDDTRPRNPTEHPANLVFRVGLPNHPIVSLSDQIAPSGPRCRPIQCRSYHPGDKALDVTVQGDALYCPSHRAGKTYDGFIYDANTKTANLLQATVAQKHHVEEGGIDWLLNLGVWRFRFFVVGPSQSSYNFSFPKSLNAHPCYPQETPPSTTNPEKIYVDGPYHVIVDRIVN